MMCYIYVVRSTSPYVTINFFSFSLFPCIVLLNFLVIAVVVYINLAVIVFHVIMRISLS